MSRTVYIGRLFGIELRLHISWFIIFFLVTFLLVEPNYDRWFYWLLGICASLLFFASVLAHEIAHSLAGRVNGIPMKNITLFIFGGMAMMTKEASRPVAEFWMAIAGPLCSLALCAVFGLLWLLLPVTGPAAAMLSWLAMMNGVLAVFNLIPGFPLDGGRVLRSVLWSTTGNYILASRIAIITGRGFGYLLILGGVLVIILRPFSMGFFDGLWICFIGWFLSTTASASYRELKRKQVNADVQPGVITDIDYRVLPGDREREE